MTGDGRVRNLCLYPVHRVLADEEGIYQDLELPLSGSSLLPYVVVNMVSSVDGRSSVGGKASGIGGVADRGAMRALRSCVDAVMVGAGTLRAERLNLGLDAPDTPQPLAVIVGGTRDVPILERLVGRQQDVLLAVPEGVRSAAAPGTDRLTVVETPDAGEGHVDLGWLLGHLKAEHAVDRLLVEGGPSLNSALVDAGLVNELFLTVAPKLLAGREAAILRGVAAEAPGVSRSLHLISVHSSGSELFLRYRIEAP